MDIVSLTWAALMVVFYIFPFTRNMGKEWTLEILQI